MRLLTNRGHLPYSDSFPAYSPWMQFVDGHWVAPLCHIYLLESLLIVPTTGQGASLEPKALIWTWAPVGGSAGGWRVDT